MLRLSKILLIALFLPLFSVAQECTFQIKGHIRDESTGVPISYANIFLKESQQGSISDEKGFFLIENICAGSYHIDVSHIGCETKDLYITIQKDTVLDLTMDHYSHILHGVEVKGKRINRITQQIETIPERKITQNTTKNLSILLEDVVGVSILKNGSGITKPVIHGLYGNRITILNNGIPQSGQQWGNDHAPEIDPLAANEISVIKGVGTLAYQGNSLGGVVLVKPKSISSEPHLHSKGSYFFESNGRSHALNIQLQKYHSALAWKIIGTYKRSGDKKTADYHLRNTGTQEANLAVLLEKPWTNKLKTSLYFSTFNTTLGVLRGSHIGNTTDLEEALQRDVPFYTIDTFHYAIKAPKQEVQHHLLKLNGRYQLSDKSWLDFTYAGQINNREEYDVRRGGRTERPALNLSQITHFAEAKYTINTLSNIAVTSGLQFKLTDNTNVSGTGVLPLIPDYIAAKTGAFILANKKYDHLMIEGAARYDYTNQDVAAIDVSTRKIVRYRNHFHSYGISAGAKYSFPTTNLAANIGYLTRNPDINELYSSGLHQGVSGIEEGDPNITNEKSLKTTFSLTQQIQKSFSFETLVYFQNIKNYIYLQPQKRVRLTIRGAFPVFIYQQTDAQLYGLDFSTRWQANDHIGVKLTYSYIKGKNTTENIPLINIPSNNLGGAITYQLEKAIYLENIELELASKYVFKQSDITIAQDYVTPPDGYSLFSFSASADKRIGEHKARMYFRIENMLNTTYRDYLNRQRYFADDLGINISLGVHVSI